MVRNVTNQHLLSITIQIRIQRCSVVAVAVAVVAHQIQKVQMARTSDYSYDLGHSSKYRIVYRIMWTKIISLRMHKGRSSNGLFGKRATCEQCICQGNHFVCIHREEWTTNRKRKKTHIHTHKLNCECERNQNATMAKKQKTQIVAGIYPFVTSTDIKHSLNIHTKHTHTQTHTRTLTVTYYVYNKEHNGNRKHSAKNL